MTLQSTKVPALYQIPARLDPDLKRHLESVSEALNVRLGRRGDPLDRAVTLRELMDGGIAKRYRSSAFDPNIGTSGHPDFVSTIEIEQTDFTQPPQPTSLVAGAAFTSITLTWANPQMSNLAYTEITRATVNDLAVAVTRDRTSAYVWTDSVGYGETYYYWVRFVSTSGVEGPWSVSATGTTEEDIAAVMAALSEDLSALPGYTTLNSTITTNIATAKAEAIAGGAYIIRATSAPTVRDTSPTTPLQQYDVWIDTDDTNQMYVRNSANDGWVEARDGTLVTLVGTSSFTGTTISAAMATAQADVITVTTAQSATSTAVTNLTAVVDTKAKTFAQDGIPTSTAVGDLWIDTNDNNKIYRAEAVGADQITSGEWVALPPSTLQTFAQAGIPTSVNIGDLWVDTDDDNKMYRAASVGANEIAAGEWVAVDDTRITTTSDALESLTTTVTGTGGHASQLASLNSSITTKARTFAQDGIPTSTAVGDIWIDTNDNNKIYRAASVGADQIVGGEWVVVGADTNTTFAQDTEPGSSGLLTGDLWIDTDSDPANKLYRWDGDSWESIEDARLTTSASAVSNLSTAVDLSGATSGKIVALESTVNNETSGVVATAGVVTNLTATVNTQAKTFAQAAAPTDSSISGQPLKEGDLWVDTDDNNKMYRWNDTNNSWIALGQRTVFSQNDVPTSGVLAGDFWVDTNDGNRFYRAAANDSNEIASGEWEVFADITTAAGSFSTISGNVTNAQNTANSKTKTFRQNGIPTAITIGDVWIDTDDGNKMYIAAAVGSDQITGGEWEEATDGQIVAAQQLAASKIKVFSQGRTTDGVPTAITIGDIWCDTDSTTTIVTGGTFDGSSGSIIDTNAETITLTTSQYNSLTANQGVTYSNGGGGSVVGLTNAATYFVIKATTPKIKLAISPGRAINDDPVNLTGVGSGSSHSIGTSVTESNIVHIANATGTGGWVRRDNSTIQSSASSVTTLQQTSDSLTGQSSASHVLQVNSNGHIAGMAISAETSPSGQTESDIIFQADKFYITSSNASSTNVAPFIVDSSTSPPVVYIDTAKIKDGAITSAKIGSLDAGTISSGTLNVGERIAANAIQANKLAIDNVTLDTYVDGSTTRLRIKDLGVSTAKITDLAVQTLKIGANAFTIPTAAHSASATDITASSTSFPASIPDVMSVTWDSTGAPTFVHFYMDGEETTNNPIEVEVVFKLDDVVISTFAIVPMEGDNSIVKNQPFPYSRVLGAGGHTLTGTIASPIEHDLRVGVKVRQTGGGTSTGRFTNKSLMIIEAIR